MTNLVNIPFYSDDNDKPKGYIDTLKVGIADLNKQLTEEVMKLEKGSQHLNMDNLKSEMAQRHEAVYSEPTYIPISQEALSIVQGPRAQAYGSVLENFTRVAKLWSAVLNTHVSDRQVGLCMVLLKVSRESHKHGRGNLVDIAGYAETLDMLEREKEAFLADPK